MLRCAAASRTWRTVARRSRCRITAALIWYSPRVMSQSTNPAPAACTSIRTRPSPPTGSGTSSSRRNSDRRCRHAGRARMAAEPIRVPARRARGPGRPRRCRSRRRGRARHARRTARPPRAAARSRVQPERERDDRGAVLRDARRRAQGCRARRRGRRSQRPRSPRAVPAPGPCRTDTATRGRDPAGGRRRRAAAARRRSTPTDPRRRTSPRAAPAVRPAPPRSRSGTPCRAATAATAGAADDVVGARAVDRHPAGQLRDVDQHPGPGGTRRGRDRRSVGDRAVSRLHSRLKATSAVPASTTSASRASGASRTSRSPRPGQGTARR